MDNFPLDIPFSASKPASHSQSYLSKAQSFATTATSNGAHEWQFELTTGLLKDPLLRKVWAFLNSHPEHKPFDIELPIHSKPLGAVSGIVTATAALSKGEENITFVNYTPSIGDFFRTAGHSKVYQISDANGQAATIYPPLFQSVGVGEVFNVNDVKFTVRKLGRISEFSIDATKLTKLKFKCSEKI